MIAELGHLAVIIAFMVAIVQSVVPMIGASKGYIGWMDAARPSAIIQFLLIFFAFIMLTISFVTSDFSVKLVASNSHSLKPLLYKISGVWGNHEGSMLLWILILAFYGALVAVFGKRLPIILKARVLSVQAMIGVAFIAFLLFTSNPFERLIFPPFDGKDLNPLLQDPGLAFHPPFLYFGYVGLSMTFSFAIAALIQGSVDAAWARWVRPWALLAWITLTIGIALGSWWAYYELGWGGWWFWDPVENASFMPWLAGTALLHSSTVVEKRDTLKGWTILLAIITFSLSLLGTFLVRSGVLTSVHTFASDPARGVFILALLVIVIGGSLTLYAWRAPALVSTGIFQPISREGALLLNNLIMATATAAVLLGTLYPLLIDTMGGEKISVGPPFFNSVFIPLMIPMIAAMAFGPMLSWKRADIQPAMARLWIAVGIAVVAMLTAALLVENGPLMGVVGIGLAAWLFTGTLVELSNRIRLFKISLIESIKRLVRTPRSYWGMTLGHLGLAIAIAGMTGAGAWKIESIQTMKPNEAITVAGYNFTFRGAKEGQGPNYSFVRGIFNVSRNGQEVAILAPEKRTFNVSKRMTTEAAIHSMLLGDLYVVVGEETSSSGTYVTRIYFNPLVIGMWVGALIMIGGGVLSLTDRRYRIGTPAGRRVNSLYTKTKTLKA